MINEGGKASSLRHWICHLFVSALVSSINGQILPMDVLPPAAESRLKVPSSLKFPGPLKDPKPLIKLDLYYQIWVSLFDFFELKTCKMKLS